MALPGLLHLHTAGISLVSQHLGPSLLSLLLVDELHENPLVLEHITLSLQVKFVVQVAVDLLGLPVSLEKPPEHSHPLHPELLLVCPGVGCALPLSKTAVTSLPPGLVVGPDPGPGVDGYGLLDDETILDQLPNVGPGVSVGDLVDLVGIKPHLLLSTFHNISREAFLKLERAHDDGSRQPLSCRSESSNIL